MEKNLLKIDGDRIYNDPSGKEFHHHGRSLLLIRNVGHLMTSPSIILGDNSEIPEGIMDAFYSHVCFT